MLGRCRLINFYYGYVGNFNPSNRIIIVLVTYVCFANNILIHQSYTTYKRILHRTLSLINTTNCILLAILNANFANLKSKTLFIFLYINLYNI